MTCSPRVSVIVPVHNVALYLGECLDSILDQDFRDLELIAVDDCSPDSCAQILRSYQHRDARLRIVSLNANVGLGRARNAGLEVARGRYVWFIDSDDTICPGTLGRIVQRAEDTSAEVVLFGWMRTYEDRPAHPARGCSLIAAAPEAFTVAEWPDIMRVLQVAWNKLIRRDLLERTGLRFPAGFYEDTAFTYPLLASARSISTLPHVVVRYRQRNSGAITRTRSSRHLEVFAQWRRAMKRVAELDVGDERLRAELFPVMIRHCTYILMEGQRVPMNRIPEFMLRLRKLFRTFQPRAGYHAKTLGENVELEIVRIGSPTLLKLFWQVRRHVRRWYPSASRGQTTPPKQSRLPAKEARHRSLKAAAARRPQRQGR